MAEIERQHLYTFSLRTYIRYGYCFVTVLY